MFTLTSLRSPLRSSAMRSRTGATAWHGPHHSAQKSTSTGVSLWSTSCSKLCSVTGVDMSPFLTDGPVVPLFQRFRTPGCSLLTIESMFESLPQYPDHLALEEEILAWWDAERIFAQLRERNRDGPKFSFMDGPITANNPMGAHHCWGRTLKDVFQRYKALRGHELRYQNGFDCQGLWVEVGVERELGLNSKREIEEYGIAEFAERCKERVAEYAEVITQQSRRLGMWMDWDNDYYTFSDTNIEYIWRFLKECHARGWLYKGHRSVEWCPRCGTSLSQHELINSYAELTHPSLYVRIAPGCGAEDFELSRVHDLPVLTPIDEAGKFYKDYGEFEGRSTEDVEGPVVVELERRGLLVQAGSVPHRYPICWRCSTPLVFRIADDWMIGADEIRQPMLDTNATVEWTPDFYSKRMDDWLRNMGDWNISRRRYFGLPLPFYPCDSCGRLTVIGSLAELRERATGGLEQLQELHRPWIDEVPIGCECGAEVRRVTEVGDAWLDAGIVPFSTLGWQNPEWQEHGYATGAAAGLTGADLPDHAYWEEWYPADWVSENRAQIRLWFYSQCFMAISLVGRQPYRSVLTYENLLDEHGREMHKSWGNAIELNEALERMGADVMRWLYCEQNPSQELRFGYALADDVKRRLLTFWNSVSFFVKYANVEGFDSSTAAGQLRPLDRWLIARTGQFVREATAAYERFWP